MLGGALALAGLWVLLVGGTAVTDRLLTFHSEAPYGTLERVAADGDEGLCADVCGSSFGLVSDWERFRRRIRRIRVFIPTSL